VLSFWLVAEIRTEREFLKPEVERSGRVRTFRNLCAEWNGILENPLSAPPYRFGLNEVILSGRWLNTWKPAGQSKSQFAQSVNYGLFPPELEFFQQLIEFSDDIVRVFNGGHSIRLPGCQQSICWYKLAVETGKTCA
jgi:hypothetical protein